MATKPLAITMVPLATLAAAYTILDSMVKVLIVFQRGVHVIHQTLPCFQPYPIPKPVGWCDPSNGNIERRSVVTSNCFLFVCRFIGLYMGKQIETNRDAGLLNRK